MAYDARVAKGTLAFTMPKTTTFSASGRETTRWTSLRTYTFFSRRPARADGWDELQDRARHEVPAGFQLKAVPYANLHVVGLGWRSVVEKTIDLARALVDHVVQGVAR